MKIAMFSLDSKVQGWLYSNYTVSWFYAAVQELLGF